MRQEVSAVRAIVTTDFGVPSAHRRARLGPTRFAVTCRALWPRKTAEEVAWRSGVAVRTAKHWLKGDREPSLVAVAAIVNEITVEFKKSTK